MSERPLPEDIGRVAMVEKVAEGVRRAMAEAGITDPADVHYVQTKTPLLTIETIRDAHARGQTTYYDEPHGSMDMSNGTTALGIAVALGEIEMPEQEQVMRDFSLFSAVASCSSGVELDRAQIVVVGNARGHGGSYRDRPLGDEGRAGPGRHLGRHPRRRPRAARAPAPHRPRRPAGQRLPQVRGRPDRLRSAAGATPCSTTPTSSGTGRSRRPSAASPRR